VIKLLEPAGLEPATDMYFHPAFAAKFTKNKLQIFRPAGDGRVEPFDATGGF